MPKDVQTTIILHSFHMLARSCSKSFKLGFSSMWTENWQVYNLGLEKAEEPEIKLPTSADHRKKASEFQKNICFIDYTKAFDCVGHSELWKFLKEMGILDHLTHLLRNLLAGKEATVRIRHGTTNWLKIGKGVHQGCILSSCLLNLYSEYIMWNASLDKSKSEIKIARRNINNLRYADNTTLGRKWRGT